MAYYLMCITESSLTSISQKGPVNWQYKEWPAKGVESVKSCPACGSDRRVVLHKNLEDWFFFCAPGYWRLQQCLECSSAYLDPRPTPDTIHLAYREYYTHVTLKPSRGKSQDLSLRGYIQTALRNGYRNARFGAKFSPATRVGALLMLLLPSRRRHAERLCRHLPRVWPGAKLLDVGSGNGEFLQKAQDMGWEVVGVDPDPQAVEASTAHGLDVRHGGIEKLRDDVNAFDVITMSHVIEHVHKPADLLTSAYRLLKPGGRVWIDTPNIEAFGHKIFGGYWRGLEPPRHLTIFSWQSLERLLRRQGFCNIQRKVCRTNFVGLARQSHRVMKGTNEYRANSPRWRETINPLLTGEARIRVALNYRGSEFITLNAYKPKK